VEKDQMAVDSSKVSGPAADLATALRSLRSQAGGMSLREIARRAGTISHTTVADALSGARIPSWAVISAFVRACGGDEEQFRRVWLAARNSELALADGDEAFTSRYLLQAASVDSMAFLPGLTVEPRPRFDDLYLPQYVVPQSGGNGTGLFELDDDVNRAVLLGSPGSGKSVACRALMLRHAHDPEQRVPFLIYAREFAAVMPPSRSLADHIAHTVESVFQVPVPDGAVRRLLEQGKALVMIDGLDELTAATARATVAVIELFCREFPAAQVLVTTRPAGYMQAQLDPELFEPYQLCEFSQDQVAEYVHRWLSLGFRPSDAGERWLAAFVTETGWLREIAANPLLLTMICQLYVSTGSLPRNRADLLARMSELLIKGWDKVRGIGAAPSSADAVTPALQYMACQMLDAGCPELTGRQARSLLAEFLAGALPAPGQAASAAQEILQYSRDRTWILREAGRASDGDAIYRFTHLTFMEYLAADYLTQRPDAARELARRLSAPQWRFAAELAADIAARNTQGGFPEFLAAMEREVNRLQPDERPRAIDFIRQYQASHAALDVVRQEQRDDAHATPSGGLAYANPLETAGGQQAAALRTYSSLSHPRPATRVGEDLMDTARNVFLIHGRDSQLAESFRDILQAVGLRPLGWAAAVLATGRPAPYVGEVLERAVRLAQAIVVVLSPDDIVTFHPDMVTGDSLQETRLAGQPGPNVIFELGMAMALNPERTIPVEVGHLKPITDLAGLNVIRFDGSAIAVKKLLDRLRLAGCPVPSELPDIDLNARAFSGE
jgi:transcriptional regulator with XRE-family HTH domain